MNPCACLSRSFAVNGPATGGRISRLALLLALALPGLTALRPHTVFAAGLELGLYKDGQLVETIGKFSAPAENEVDGTTPAGATTTSPRKNPNRPLTVSAPQINEKTRKRNEVFSQAIQPASQIQALLQQMKGKAGNPTDRQQLETLVQQFMLGQDQVRATMAETVSEIVGLGLDATIIDRQVQTMQNFEMELALFKGLLDDVAAGKPNALEQALLYLEQQKFQHIPSLDRIAPTIQSHVLKAPEMTREQADVLAAKTGDSESQGKRKVGLPNLKDPSASNSRSGGAVPMYNPPSESDLAETIDVQITQAIKDKATALGNSPLAIYEFVRNNVTFQAYLGSRKGSAFTLQQLAGNDTDQASLLLALLRAAGIPCRYVRGSIEMTPEQAKSWLGVEDARTAGSILTTAGLDGLNIVDGSGNVTAIRCTRVWVEAYVPYSNYRGVPNDNTGKAWIPIDPAFKGNTVHAGEDVLAAMGFNTDTFLADYISTFHAQSPIEKLQADIQTWLNVNRPGQTVADIERTLAVSALNLGLLPASLPYQVMSRSSGFAELESTKRYSVRFHLYTGGTTFIDYTLSLPELITKRLTIDYVGATPADQATIDAYGGVYQTPPNLVNVRPRLKLDNNPVVISANSSGMGYTHSWDMQFIQPVGDQNQQPVISNDITAGNGQSVAFDTFLDVPLGFLAGGSSSSGSLLESTLYDTAAEYLSRVDRGEEAASRLMRTVTTVDISEAIVENSVKVAYSFGTPVTFEWTGLIVDADRRIIGPFAVSGDSARKVPYMKLTGYDASNMENRVFEDMYAQEAISTIKILELANDAGIGVCTITTSIGGQCPGFSQSASVVSAVNAALAQGHHVIIPKAPITVHLWSGTAYIDLDPATGAAGYIISGGISGNISVAGGATVDVWPIDLGCAPIGPVTGTITPNGFSDGEILCPDGSYIKYTVTLQYDCKDAQGNVQHKTFPATSHTVPYTKKEIVENPNWGSGVYTISIPGSSVQPVTFTLLDVISLKPDKGQEIDDGDNNDDTKTYVVCFSSTAGDKVTLTATADPTTAEASLPNCWSLVGGTGSGKLNRTIDQTNPDKIILIAKSGTREKKTTIYVVKIEFTKAPAEDATGNKHGYDTMDTPPSKNDDHVSVKKGETTLVKVDIQGADNVLPTTFKSSDATIADVADVPDPVPASFLLKVVGKGTGSTVIKAFPGNSSVPACGSITANAYKSQDIAKWSIYRVTDSASAGTSPLSALTATGVQTAANSIVKQGVMSFTDVDVVDKDLHYDKNGNGALDWFYDGGTQTEYDEIKNAGLTGNPKVVVVKSVNFGWRLSQAAVVGANKITLQGSDYLSSWTGYAYILGTGANEESVSIKSMNGNEATLQANLTKAHAVGDVLVGQFGAGVGADPQIVEDGADVQTTLLHETLHRSDVGNLLDVDSANNIMNYSTGTGQTELRFKPLPKKYQAGTECQWEKIPRP